MDKEGDLRVWWMPQVPMSTPFFVNVKELSEANLVLDTLAYYDLFQLENNIKPDYSNAGGLEIFEEGEWIDWYDKKDGFGFDEYREEFLIEENNGTTR